MASSTPLGPGEVYPVLLVEDGWVLAAGTGDPPELWWIEIDSRVELVAPAPFVPLL